jgi:hypothetical protein
MLIRFARRQTIRRSVNDPLTFSEGSRYAGIFGPLTDCRSLPAGGMMGGSQPPGRGLPDRITPGHSPTGADPKPGCNEFARKIARQREWPKENVMRFALCLMGIMGAGAWGFGATHGIVPGPGQMFQAATAIGADPAKATKVDPAVAGIVDINPVRTYYNVMRQVTSGKVDLGIESKPVVVAPLNPMYLPPNTADLAANAAKNGFSGALQSQVEENNRRMRDMAAYTRNPSAWHGMPPH